MANYTPINNFTAKDSLPSGDPNKKARGTDIQAELNAIAAAIVTKANVDVPQTFTEPVSFSGPANFTNDVGMVGNFSVSGDTSLATVTSVDIDCGTY